MTLQFVAGNSVFFYSGSGVCYGGRKGTNRIKKKN